MKRKKRETPLTAQEAVGGPQTNKQSPRFLRREHFSLILSFVFEISYVSWARFLSAKCSKYFEDFANV